MNGFRYPTMEEIQAMQRGARRARAEGLARLAKAAVSLLALWFAHPHSLRVRVPVDLERPRHA